MPASNINVLKKIVRKAVNFLTYHQQEAVESYNSINEHYYIDQNSEVPSNEKNEVSVRGLEEDKVLLKSIKKRRRNKGRENSNARERYAKRVKTESPEEKQTRKARDRLKRMQRREVRNARIHAE